MATKRPEQPHVYTVSVVGLSGTENIKGPVGVGKSCLCNRFVKPAYDDFYDEHQSFLSAADFNGQVINNDHFLYWGKANRPVEDGTEYLFHVIEQTEFLDDTTFAPLRGGRTDPYLKRCSQTKIQSAEKLMYICRDQLGLEDQYDRVTFPSGKVTVDGFICVIDVSKSQQRTPDSQIDFLTKVLHALVKTKKPIVMAACKMDEGSEAILQEAHKILSRKEFKGLIPLVETSALLNVNTDLPFMLLASMIDKSRAMKPKLISYSEAAKLNEEKSDSSLKVFHMLLSTVVQDYRLAWPACRSQLSANTDYNLYIHLFGENKAFKQFKNRVNQLRHDFITKRKAEYLGRVPGMLDEFFPSLHTINGRSWSNCLKLILERRDFSTRFVETRRWTEDDKFLDSGDKRMPFELMMSQEVEAIFMQHVNALQAELQRQQYKKEFGDFVCNHEYVLPGAPLTEMESYFKGYDCYDKLSVIDRQEVYQKVQIDLKDRARRAFLELLYERMDIFQKYDDPDKSITQEDVESLMDLLRSEPQCRALSRCEEDRKVIMLNHLGFIQYPLKEQCPFRANCMELSLQRSLSAKQKRSHNSQNHYWTLNPHEKLINLLIIGSDGLATDLIHEIRMHYEDDEYIFDEKVYSLDYRTIEGDVSLPQNSLRIPDFVAHGCICVYSSEATLDFIKDTISKTFLAPNDERLQYQGLPVVLVQALDSQLSEKKYLQLKEEGHALAQRMRCEFIDMPELIDMEECVDFNQFYENQIPRSMREIAIQLATNDAVDSPLISKSPFGDIRLLMCHMCADPYSLDTVLQPFLAMQSCYVVTNDRYHVIQFDTYIADVKRKVEVILASYHEATLLRDEYCEGYIMVYSTKRKASYSTIESFITKIPSIPSLVVAVNDVNMNDSDLLLTNKGRLLAQEHHCLFITTSDFHNQSPYMQLLGEVWDFKMLIRDKSYNTSTLDSSFNSTNYEENSPSDPYKSYGIGQKQWGDLRNALYLGGGWIDNNDVYHKDRIHAPLVDRLEIPDYEDPADALSDSSEEYALVHDALPAGKIQRIHSTLKKEFKPAFPYTDSESDLSSLERNPYGHRSPVLYRRGVSPMMGVNMISPHGQRRALSPMSPRVDTANAPERKSNSLPRTVVHRVNVDSHWDNGTHSRTQTMRSDTPSEGSESAGDEGRKSGGEVKRKKSLKSLKFRKADGMSNDEEIGFFDIFRNNSEKQKQKKMEKRKQKEEEKILRDKQKSVRRNIKSRLKRQSYLNKTSGMVLQDYVQAEGQLIPRFVELCVKHIESEGLTAEGIYRIPGNMAHVELLKELYSYNHTIDLQSLDTKIGINAVATALKKFFHGLQEPLIPTHLNEELYIADRIPENSSRLLALRGIIKKLPPANHEVLRYLVTHLYKVTKHSSANNMDSKNLAICWWPTIIRPEIMTVEDMQNMGTAMQDITITLIEQHGFFFYNEHEV